MKESKERKKEEPVAYGPWLQDVKYGQLFSFTERPEHVYMRVRDGADEFRPDHSLIYVDMKTGALWRCASYGLRVRFRSRIGRATKKER